MNGATRKDQDVLGCMSGTKPDHRSAGTDPDITEPAVKQKKPLRLQIGSIFQALLAAWVASLAILVAAFKLYGWELLLSVITGVTMGLGLCFLYFWNRKKKAERNALLASVAGMRGIQEMLHKIPTWINFRETEKMEWLNEMLVKAWPYYDAAICAAIKAQVEPLMEQYKPPGMIKKIYFHKLTFGDDPFRVEGIRVEEEGGQLQIDVSFRWAGDANIVLGIELLGEGTRMAPKVSDLAVSGEARIILRPLLNEIPGFGAATVSLLRQPVVRFKLNFGSALGGGVTAGAVRAWLDPFMRDTLAGMLVWPKRLVIPLLPPEVTGPLDDLQLRHKGVLQVDIIEAKDLPKMDAMGAADPSVEAFTLSEYRDSTDVKKNTLTPRWDQRLWFLVQEPDSQILKMNMYDTDLVNVKEMFRVNVLKGATEVFGSKTLMGRAMFRVAVAAESPGRPVEKWLPLGPEDFNELAESCGVGRGELHFRATYWPFQLIKGHAEADMGAVIVTVIRCNHLLPMDPLGTSDPYVVCKLNRVARTTDIRYRTLDPEWGKSFEWYKVPCDEILKVKVMDHDALSSDEVIGYLEVDIGQEIARAPGGDLTRTWELEDLPHKPKSVERPSITMRIQWIPFKLR